MGDAVKTRCMSKSQNEQPTLPDVVSRIVGRCDPARLMELYYWSQEPGLLEIIRAVSAMPQATRAGVGGRLVGVERPALARSPQRGRGPFGN